MSGESVLVVATALDSWLPAFGIIVGWALKSCSDYWLHRKAFDQRLRLEKEYQLYLDLWDKLFDFRRTIGTAMNWGTHPEDMPSDDELRRVFNDLQAAVRRGEPFYSAAIATSAGKTTLPARQLLQNLRDIYHLNRQANDDGERVHRMEDENKELFAAFEMEFNAIRTSIRQRVGPP
jgi:hypothetical protein